MMLAMGAGAAAFSAARKVVLAEGATEMLMLPSLIKKAIRAEDLDYQVAPGLSEVPVSMYPELDLEGARVAFLVDGDDGGSELRDALIEAGVPEEMCIRDRSCRGGGAGSRESSRSRVVPREESPELSLIHI